MTTSQDSWEEEFEYLVTYAQGDEDKARLLRLLNNLLFTVQKEAYQRGKDYWEPSDHHKEVWRQEGREEAVEYLMQNAEPVMTNHMWYVYKTDFQAAKHPNSSNP